jgi:predicted transcriptional regulator
MSEVLPSVEKRIRLSEDRVARLERLAQERQMSEDQVIEKALDLLFSMLVPPDTQMDHQDWSALSEESLGRIWDNDQDAAYDNWQELYGSSAR